MLQYVVHNLQPRHDSQQTNTLTDDEGRQIQRSAMMVLPAGYRHTCMHNCTAKELTKSNPSKRAYQEVSRKLYIDGWQGAPPA